MQKSRDRRSRKDKKYKFRRAEIVGHEEIKKSKYRRSEMVGPKEKIFKKTHAFWKREIFGVINNCQGNNFIEFWQHKICIKSIIFRLKNVK